MSHVSCQYLASKVLFQHPRWKWAVVDKTSRRESLESLWMRKRMALWDVGHFPSRSMVEMPDFRGASRLIIFSVFRFLKNPILNWLPNFPACFATVADRLAMRGGAGAGKQLSSWPPAEIEQGGAKTMSQQRRAKSASLRRSVGIREMARI